MSYRKYLDDYRVEEYVDEKGRTKKRAIYVGGDYKLYPAIKTGNKRLILALSILLWIPFVCALFLESRATQLFYTALPFIFTSVPIYLLAGASISLVWHDELMTREKADKIAVRLPMCSITVAILSAVALIGLVITALFTSQEMLRGDLIFGAMSLINAAAATLIFSKCRLIKATLAD